MDDISSYLAHNLKTLRETNGLSQLQLAKAAGIPRANISYMESGSGNPSLSNLSKVAGALKVQLEELLSPPKQELVVITKKEDLKVLKRAGGEALITKILPKPLPGFQIEHLILKPGAHFRGTPHLRNTKEYLYCSKGEISVTIEGEKYTLMEGDTLSFPGDLPHGYSNTGASNSVAFSVISL